MTNLDKASHLDENELAAFIAGTLRAPARESVESHLADCSECRSVLALYSMAASRMEPVSQAELTRRRGSLPWSGLFRSFQTAWALPLAAGLLLAMTTTALIVLLSRPSQPSLVKSPQPAPASTTDQQTPEPLQQPQVSKDSTVQPQPGKAKTQPTPHLPDFDNTLLARRGGRKIIAGKTFLFRNGIWIDGEYQASNGLPLVEIKKSSPDYDRLVAEEPSLVHYAEAGPSVIVVLSGKAYKFTP